jgi:hypothetical protein
VPVQLVVDPRRANLGVALKGKFESNFFETKRSHFIGPRLAANQVVGTRRSPQIIGSGV